MGKEVETVRGPASSSAMTASAEGKWSARLPAVDVMETDDGVILLADLPGCDDASVDVRVEEGVLTISGVPRSDMHHAHDLVYQEGGEGEFNRSFSVSQIIDIDKMKAAMKDGVLRLTLPKAEKAKPKAIPIKTE